MDQYRNEINRYCDLHSSNLDVILHDLERETHLKTLAPQMISGSLQGKLLTMISKMIAPKNILEIGTFTGYATLCLAQGLQPDGRIKTIEVNRELSYISHKYFSKTSYKEKIDSIVGDAREIIPTLKDTYDLIFIDAGKKDNGFYYEHAIKLITTGGYILVDNVLWDGKVVHDKEEKQAKKIHEFNQMVNEDSRVENVMIPIRDGLSLMRKI